MQQIPQFVWIAVWGALFVSSCARPTPRAASTLNVAAAANLTGVFEEVGAAFRKQTGTEVVLSYGSTAQLTQQIDNGAPFDVFAAADTEHIDQLIKNGRLLADSRATYARGQLALWIPKGDKSAIREMKDLTRPEIRFVSVAQPALAPYGKAAVEAMQAAGIWDALQPKIVYANDIRMARQYAITGNADAAFTAYSLVLKERGSVVRIDPKLHTPIDQALGIVTSSRKPQPARQFTAFLRGSEGRHILSQSGYLIP
jgi:molybdate transport system substrate-binding protein